MCTWYAHLKDYCDNQLYDLRAREEAVKTTITVSQNLLCILSMPKSCVLYLNKTTVIYYAY